MMIEVDKSKIPTGSERIIDKMVDKYIEEERRNIKDCGYIDDKEPVYIHPIEELKPKEDLSNFVIIYPDNQELMNKINEIIRVVNIINRGGR